MDGKHIIMNFTRSPSEEDMGAIAQGAFELLPEELLEFCDEISVEIENFPDESTRQEHDLDDLYLSLIHI